MKRVTETLEGHRFVHQPDLLSLLLRFATGAGIDQMRPFPCQNNISHFHDCSIDQNLAGFHNDNSPIAARYWGEVRIS